MLFYFIGKNRENFNKRRIFISSLVKTVMVDSMITDFYPVMGWDNREAPSDQMLISLGWKKEAIK